MVDWDRVEQLRGKGWDWDEIAEDSKVGFQADQNAGDPGRALRVLYHRRRGRESRKDTPAGSAKTERERTENRWSLARLGFLVVPVFAVWFILAFLIPSPVGLILPAFPWIALGLAVTAFLLIWGLVRADKRWSRTFRNTLIGGVVIGLVFTGVIALTGTLLFGCPYLPSTSSLTSQPDPGWKQIPVSPWQDGGKPVMYFYGATWCPFCSASSWSIWKALTEYGSVAGATLQYSSADPAGPYTPEVNLANAVVTSKNLSFQVSEDTSNVQGNVPGTANCFQQAYVTAYSGGAIPFLVVNGQYVHGGTTIVQPSALATWSNGASGGYGTVQSQVQNENGSAWNAIGPPAFWIMAYIAKSCGFTGATLSHLPEYSTWSSAVQKGVSGDLGQIS